MPFVKVVGKEQKFRKGVENCCNIRQKLFEELNCLIFTKPIKFPFHCSYISEHLKHSWKALTRSVALRATCLLCLGQ